MPLPSTALMSSAVSLSGRSSSGKSFILEDDPQRIRHAHAGGHGNEPVQRAVIGPTVLIYLIHEVNLRSQVV